MHPSCNTRRWFDHFNGGTALVRVDIALPLPLHPHDELLVLFARETIEAALLKNYQHCYSLHDETRGNRLPETIPRCAFTGTRTATYISLSVTTKVWEFEERWLLHWRENPFIYPCDQMIGMIYQMGASSISVHKPLHRQLFQDRTKHTTLLNTRCIYLIFLIQHRWNLQGHAPLW